MTPSVPFSCIILIPTPNNILHCLVLQCLSYNYYLKPNRSFFLLPCQKTALSKHKGNITMLISFHLRLKLDKATFLRDQRQR